MTRILTILLAGVGVALLPGDSPRAGCRHVAVHHQKQAAVVFAPQYAQPYYYSVGAPYQYEAIKQQIKAELRAEQGDVAPQTEQLTVAADRWSLVRQYCVGCHTTNEVASTAMDLSDLANLDCESRLECIKAVVDGRMPKGKKLPPDVMGNLIGQFVNAATAPGANAPVVEQLVVPEPPKPTAAAPKWKFNQGDVLYLQDWPGQRFVVQVKQTMSDGARNYYGRLIPKDVPFTATEDQLSWRPFEEAKASVEGFPAGLVPLIHETKPPPEPVREGVTWLPASEVPPPKSVTPAPADPYVESLHP